MIREKTRIIEGNSVRRAYNMWCSECIVDNPKHGRLYVTQGFGGMDSPYGGQYRWRHGVVVSVEADAILAELTERDDIGNSWVDYMIHGTKPGLLTWDGDCIERMMDTAKEEARG